MNAVFEVALTAALSAAWPAASIAPVSAAACCHRIWAERTPKQLQRRLKHLLPLTTVVSRASPAPALAGGLRQSGSLTHSPARGAAIFPVD